MLRLAVIISYLSRHVYWMLFVVACDTFDGDRPANEIIVSETDYYVLPGSSIVIDLKAVIKQSFVSGSLAVSQQPFNGKLTRLDPFLYKYTPGASFIEGNDQFSISFSSDGSEVLTTTMNVFMKDATNDFPCSVYEIEDHSPAKPNSVTIVYPLLNDRVCGVNGQLNVSIHLNPSFGEAEVSGDSIVYRPGPSFTGLDELVYSISSDGGGDPAYGLVSIANWSIEVLTLPRYFDDMFFVNENVGFISDGTTIMKTVDGGKRWSSMWSSLDPPHSDESRMAVIRGIFFLDEHTGFAACSLMPYTVSVFPEMFPDTAAYTNGALMVTREGGFFWKRTTLPRQDATSAFFVSPSIGFMSTLSWEPLTYNVIKTNDGGETWEEVASYPAADDQGLTLRFADEQYGYAYAKDKILATNDGGETWRPTFTKDYVNSVAVTRDNVIYASIGTSDPLNYPELLGPSYIVRSEDGVTWQTMADFPHVTPQIGFSPSGEFGVAIGVMETNSVPSEWVLTIASSRDKGNTWSDVPADLNGYPRAVSVPSANVAFILTGEKLIKYTSY